MDDKEKIICKSKPFMKEFIQGDMLCKNMQIKDHIVDYVVWERNMNPVNHLNLVKEIEEDYLEIIQYFANLLTDVIN